MGEMTMEKAKEIIANYRGTIGHSLEERDLYLKAKGFLAGWNARGRKDAEIAERRALHWMDNVHIESPWDHLTVRGQIDVVKDEILSLTVEGTK